MGVLLWINLTPGVGARAGNGAVIYFVRGWPFCMNIAWPGANTKLEWDRKPDLAIAFANATCSREGSVGLDGIWYLKPILLNIVVCSCIVLASLTIVYIPAVPVKELGKPPEEPDETQK